MMTCVLCSVPEDNQLKYGELLTVDNVTVHYFCLLFSPGLYQRGEDNEGILGFLIEDIQKERKRVKRLKCRYCLRDSANLGCCVKKCSLSYHLSCGLIQNAGFEFEKRFSTFCKLHKRFKQKEKPSKTERCGICLEQVKLSEKLILIPCCKNSWFHHECLQTFANTSGVFFKCPMCNDKVQCLNQLPKLGIYLPVKDADWEYDLETYHDENQDPEPLCDSTNCLNENATPLNEFPWLWKFCSTCGSSAIHESCITKPECDFVCQMCQEILNRPKPAQELIRPKSPVRSLSKFQPWFSDDEIESDSDEHVPLQCSSNQKRKAEVLEPRFYDSAQPYRRKSLRTRVKTSG